MGFFSRLFGRKRGILPCQISGECPYEYDKNSDRDVEGMPFVAGDPRSCPKYGHVCPEFMEDFDLTAKDLNIRAAIHCGALLDQLVKDGKMDPESPEYLTVKPLYEEAKARYPEDQYPQYY